ncbi:MAG: tRNA pseudouridine(55) synthase TruB [bacterium]
MGIDGFLNAIKPPGMTSHDVVLFARRTLSVKAGHLGTLDYGAAGVLPLALGKAVRVLEYIEKADKGYRAEAHLGSSTDTQDSFGKVLSEGEWRSVSRLDVEKALAVLQSRKSQVPPLRSAISYKGERLWRRALRGENPDVLPRPVEIFSLKLIKFDPPHVVFDVLCSAGTYVRTLCRDLGEILGSGAHLSFLVRFKSGIFHLEDGIPLEEIGTLPGEGRERIIPTGELLRHLPGAIVREAFEKKLRNGVRIDPGSDLVEFSGAAPGENVRLLNSENELLAIGRMLEDGFIQPVKVFAED